MEWNSDEHIYEHIYEERAMARRESRVTIGTCNSRLLSFGQMVDGIMLHRY